MPLEIQPADHFPNVTVKQRQDKENEFVERLLPDPDKPPPPPPSGNLGESDSDDDDDNDDPFDAPDPSSQQPPSQQQHQSDADEAAFASFGGNDSFNEGDDVTGGFDDIHTMSDSRWRLFLDDTDKDLESTIFNSFTSHDNSSMYYSARSECSSQGETGNLSDIGEEEDQEDIEVNVQPPKRGLSNDHECPKLAETIDSMIHQRRKFHCISSTDLNFLQSK